MRYEDVNDHMNGVRWDGPRNKRSVKVSPLLETAHLLQYGREGAVDLFGPFLSQMRRACQPSRSHRDHIQSLLFLTVRLCDCETEENVPEIIARFFGEKVLAFEKYQTTNITASVSYGNINSLKYSVG